jgi:hypothetical protein
MSDIISNDTNDKNNPDYKRNKILTLVGCLLVQISAGIIPIWGNANIYYLSYFKNHG